MQAIAEHTQTESLKNVSVMGYGGRNGGRRPGAGRPKGKPNAKTLEKKIVMEAFTQRVMGHADDLFNAQYKLAVGSRAVFRIDEEGKGDKKKQVHRLVTNPDEIKGLLDEYEGGDGEVNGSYYYFQTIPPDNKAIDSLLNRTFGKPKETHELTGADGNAVQVDATALALQFVRSMIQDGYNQALAIEELRRFHDLAPVDIREKVAAEIVANPKLLTDGKE